MIKKLVLASLVVLLAFSVQAQDKKKKKSEDAAKADTAQPEKKETKEPPVAGTPYVYTGPDTGFGAGASGIWRNILSKEGRDATFTVTYTQKAYNSYSIELKEPQLFNKNGWGRIYAGYNNKPSRLFYGLGNDASEEDASSFGDTDIGLEPRYDYWFINKPDMRVGVQGLYRFSNFKLYNGPKIDEPVTLGERQISVVFPEFYKSDAFETGSISGGSLTFIYDDRKDKYPLPGGRDEVVFPYLGGRQEFTIGRYDKGIGSDFNYTNYSANLSYYIPIGWEFTVLALRGMINVKEGDVPWWDMNSFGSDGSLRGFHDGRYRDNNQVLFNAELRQHFDVSFSPVPYGALKVFKLTAPGVALFYDYGRVYHDVSEITWDFGGYKYSYGAGFRFIISPSVVIRADYAISEEESDFYITAGWPW